MIRRILKDIQSMSKGQGLKEKYENILIEGVSTDSRSIKEGQLFIPLIGDNFNGHSFLNKAIENGAVATLWNKEEAIPNIDFPFILVDDTLIGLQNLAREYRNQLNVKIVGVTGSNGKTTTKDITASLLATRYKTKKTMGNLNNLVGVPLTLLGLDEDTEMAVVEMATDKFGELSTLTSIVKPDVAIITSIGAAHLEDLLNKENVLKAKLEILEGLNPDGLFIYFGDDPTMKKEMGKYNIKHRTITYGSEDHNDYICNINTMNKNGLSFRLKSPKAYDFTIPLVGRHNMYNSLAGIIAATYFNVPFESLQEGFDHIEKTGLRDELVYAQGYTILNDSYKSNPDSLLEALDTMYSMENFSQKIAVMGDMLGLGKEEVELHENLGQQIRADEIDYIFTFGPLAEHIGLAAKKNFPDERIIHCSSKEEIVEKLKSVIKPNALILIKASRSLAMEEVTKSLKDNVVL